VLYIYGASEASSAWTKEFVEAIVDNRRKYCDKYGYSLLNGNQYIDSSRPAAWSKLLAVKHYLKYFDYIFYIDMDTVIMNDQLKLEHFIAAAPSRADFIMTTDWNGPNTGTATASLACPLSCLTDDLTHCTTRRLVREEQ
jgi:hypothetical protein